MEVQELSATVTAGDVTVAPEELTLKTGRYSKAAELEASGPASGDVSVAGTVTATVNDTLVFTGSVDTGQTDAYDIADVTAYDAIRTLKQTTIKADFNRESPAQIASRVAEQAGVPFESDVTGGTEYDIPVGLRSNSAGESVTTTSINDQSAATVIGRAADWANAVWYLDAEGTIQFTNNPATTIHELEYVLDASAGKRAPPYRRVVVTGSSPSSQSTDNDKPGGQGASHLFTREPVRAEATADNATDDEVRATAGSADGPTYHYQDRDIRTDQQAQQAAKAILAEFLRQQASGWVTIVGDATIRPFDVIVMPDHLGGERYVVSTVKHTLGPDVGFETRIGCGGLVEQPTSLSESDATL